MDNHPAKLIIMWPMWSVKGCISVLSAMDDGLIVHHDRDGRFELEHRPMYRFVSRGPNSYLSTLTLIASNLEANYRYIIIDDTRFLRDLIVQAKSRTSQSAREDIECAQQVLADRRAHQITDHLFEAPPEYMIGRALVGMRERRTRVRRHEQTGLNMMRGVVTPRSEQLWHSLRHGWCNPRSQQAGHRAWIKWCLNNRPPIPRGEVS